MTFDDPKSSDRCFKSQAVSFVAQERNRLKSSRVTMDHLTAIRVGGSIMQTSRVLRIVFLSSS